MAINEDQLKTWSNTGADKGSAISYNRVKSIIENSNFSKKNGVDIFIQGSYANTTHVRSDSDVDVVVKLNTIWNGDLSKLTDHERQEYERHTSESDYGHDELRQELIKIFKEFLGNKNVEEHKKCIRLILGNSYLNTDIIPCLSYRIYNSFSSTKQTDYIEGIAIKKTDGTIIYNFPKQHINNGIKKHQNTREYYKKIIRIIKNMRNRLLDEGKLQQNIAPSYFIECLYYNIPDENFGNSLQNSVLNSLNWILGNKEKINNLKCQNEVTHLFGSEETQWSISDCCTFLIVLSKIFMEKEDA